MKFDRVFFCQSYNDISYILSSINEEKYKNKLIIIVNNHSVLEFFEKLNIKDTKLHFISKKLKTLKNPIQFLLERINVFKIRKHILCEIKGAKVTVYATMIDLLTCSCIEYLVRENDVYLGIPLKETDGFLPCKKTTFKVKLLTKIYDTKLHSYFHFILKHVAGLPKSFSDKYLTPDYIYDTSKLLYVRDKYKIVFSQLPYILLLDTEVKSSFDLYKENFDQKMSQVFNYLKDYNVFLKGHPTRGASPLALENNFEIIDNKFPIEFIDFSNCLCVVGIMSIALSNIADKGIKSISLLNYIDFKDEKEKKGYFDDITSLSEAEIVFPKTIDDFKILINKYSKIN